MILRKYLLSFVAGMLAVLTTACSGGQPYSVALPVSLTITPAAVSQPVGVAQQFAATATFSDNRTSDVTQQVLWDSSSNSVATVTRSGGLGVAVAPGEATISASFSASGATVTAAASLHVTAAEIRSLAVTPAGGQLDLGANQQFTATATLTDGTSRDVTQDAAWSSGDPAVLRMNTTAGRIGLANPRGPGATTVRANVNGVAGSTEVTVARRVPKFLYAGGVFGIAGYAIDPATGTLTQIAGARFTAAASVLSLAISRDRRFLYAADIGLGLIWGFQIGASGELVALPGSPFFTSTTASPLSIVAHPAADFLLMSDISARVITVFKIASDGSLSEVNSTAPIAAQPLFATATPDGRFFYQGERAGGVATVPGFSISPDGVLSPLPGEPAATGFQPRTLTVEPSGRFLYVTVPSTSQGLSTSVYGYSIDAATGTLSPLSGSPFNAGESPVGAAADASGRFLYVANLANSPDGNSVSAFSIDEDTGALANLPGSPFSATFAPVSVIVDPGAHYLYVGMDGSQGVRAFAIDDRSGVLTELAGSPFPAPGSSLALAVAY